MKNFQAIKEEFILNWNDVDVSGKFKNNELGEEHIEEVSFQVVDPLVPKILEVLINVCCTITKEGYFKAGDDFGEMEIHYEISHLGIDGEVMFDIEDKVMEAKYEAIELENIMN